MAETITVQGIPETEAALTVVNIAAGPTRRAFQKAAITVRNDAVGHIAVYTGRARQSLAWEVDPSPMPTFARIGTNIEYGPDIEFGTSAHYVDPAVLEPWAERKGLGKNMGEAVSKHIAEHGTTAHPFLVPAFTRSQAAIEGFFAVAAQEIEALRK